tara:strand:- start:457 stop:1491 length:1035 start_codon:yes stop_codon:yes gene_type:complete
LTKEKISSLCNEVLLRVDSLLAYFDIEYVEYPNRIAFPCPVHGGDNPEACCIFTDGLTNKGNWACWTHNCHEEYVNNLFGFTRGALSYKRGKNVSMQETADFLCHLLETDLDSLEVTQQRNDQALDVFSRKISRNKSEVTRTTIKEKLVIPAKYYLGRNYSESVLKSFDVGECLAENQPMSGRVVVPIYDEDYNYVGCVGRSIKEHLQPKWLHSRGFTKNVLYGLNLAKSKILETRTAVIVEGQGDVWRAVEAGLDMTVGIFGCSINEDQLILLEQSGALNLIILTDYDDAGNKASEQIIKKCGRRFNYLRPNIPDEVKDIGDLTVEQIKEFIYPQIKELIKNE